jgi:hypothetical protein
MNSNAPWIDFCHYRLPECWRCRDDCLSIIAFAVSNCTGLPFSLDSSFGHAPGPVLSGAASSRSDVKEKPTCKSCPFCAPFLIETLFGALLRAGVRQLDRFPDAPSGAVCHPHAADAFAWEKVRADGSPFGGNGKIKRLVQVKKPIAKSFRHLNAQSRLNFEHHTTIIFFTHSPIASQ